ncbi:MAG: hypothetical protein EAZ85_15280 [Bacteroidetes bacterium]|nr:MAG: hypothetical protein EAZ85_15280 [Bacteroidota bacterium]TAG85287.1 MAG: hypothetical protein EAZ20_15645 [Bacteroidota bacterium]
MYKKIIKFCFISLISVLFIAIFIVFMTGDAQLIQTKLNHIEQRALENKTTDWDRFWLRLLYQNMIFFGQFHYPNASKMLHHYCQQKSDTLFFDAENLYKENPEVKFAVDNNKTGVIFRPHHIEDIMLHISPVFYWDLYYAFDVLSIKKEGNSVVLYDKYKFNTIETKVYTHFKIGQISLEINDGLIKVAYPKAKGFISYGKFEILTSK